MWHLSCSLRGNGEGNSGRSGVYDMASDGESGVEARKSKTVDADRTL